LFPSNFTATLPAHTYELLTIKSGFMFVRITFFKFANDHLKQARKIYHDEVLPSVKRQRGNLGVRLLEPKNKTDDYMSITEWKTKADADSYESTGVYRRLIARLEPFCTKLPELKNYFVEEVREKVDHL
jgi:quinol monooxygenase YgiN